MSEFLLRIAPIRNWIPFFALYFFAAILSENPIPTFIKLLWSIFNIAGVGILILGSNDWENLKRCFLISVGIFVLFLWTETSMVYFFGQGQWFDLSAYNIENPAPWYKSLLGFAQYAGIHGGFPIFRPSGFYYEPSYAGSALNLAFPLALGLLFLNGELTKPRLFFCVAILSALYLTSSRTALFASSLGLSIGVGAGLFMHQQRFVKNILAIFAMTIFLLLGLGLITNLSKYAVFFEDINNWSGITQRAEQSSSSEGWRIENTREGIKLFLTHPVLGVGVPNKSTDRGMHGLGQTAQSTWVEILIECGIVGFIGFVIGFGKTAYDTLRGANPMILTIIAMAFIPHLFVSLNFTATFPRLDYWLLFFLLLRWGRESQD